MRLNFTGYLIAFGVINSSHNVPRNCCRFKHLCFQFCAFEFLLVIFAIPPTFSSYFMIQLQVQTKATVNQTSIRVKRSEKGWGQLYEGSMWQG